MKRKTTAEHKKSERE